jgi:PAP2 superfamily
MASRKVFLPLAVTFLLVLVPAVWARRSPPADQFNADVAVAWFDLLYDVVKTENLSPPVAARIYGIASVTLYEAIVPGSPHHLSLVGQLNDLASLPQPKQHKKYHWPMVANSALAMVLRQLFPSASAGSLAAIESLELHFASEFLSEVPPPVFARSVTQGQVVADAVFDWAATDGYATLNNCPFTPPSGLGLWVPTPPAFNPHPLQPCWGQLVPFVLSSGAECAPPPPLTYSEDSTSAFFLDAQEVYDAVNTLTPEQQTIAQYWADGSGTTGTPAGHWIAIVGQIAKTDGLSLAAAAEAYAWVGIAVADAFMACWNTKYLYNLLRPVTYIRKLLNPAWSSFIVTPPFPEYTSGHSVQSAAAATVLSDLFGVTAFTDTMNVDHGLIPPLAPRSFPSFIAAANEAAISRLYGGIHFRRAIERGVQQGLCVGQTIVDHVKFKKWEECLDPRSTCRVERGHGGQ